MHTHNTADAFELRTVGCGLVGKLAAAFYVVAVGPSALADTFTYRDRDGQTVTVEARLAGSGQGIHALELDDGQIRLVPQAAVSERKPAEGPEPIDTAEMLSRLESRFGSDRFRAYKQDPYVIGLVLGSDLDKRDESRARSFVKKAAGFMRSVERAFLRYTRSMALPTDPPKFPLVLLIFETDADFEQYATEATGGQGLSAGNIAGFYSGLTNWLAIRLGECHTFATPLHEAIHQQVHNRGIFQRLAPIPAWFNEGIATGFEGNADRISGGPQQVSTRYALIAQQRLPVNWDEIVANDRAFGGDVLAGAAYTHAWSIHWTLVTQHRTEYGNYIRLLAAKQTLGDSDSSDRVSEFKQVFGMAPAEMQAEFHKALERTLKRKPLKIDRPKVGLAFEQHGNAEVGVSAVSRLGTGLEVEGELRNISPIRAMSFHVVVSTDSGTYADWHIANLAANRKAPLPKQRVRKVMRNGRGGSSRTFRISVQSAVPGSREAEAWKSGELPVPVFRR